MPAPSPEDMAQWPEPNYVNPKTRATALLVALVVGVVAMLPFVIARVYTRLKLKGSFGLDDWLIVASMVSSTFSAVFGITATRFGMGYHIWDDRPEWISLGIKLSITGTILFNFSLALPKLSLGFTYLRLFPSRSNRIFCYTVITTIVCWLVSVTCVSLFPCRPIQALWNKNITPKYCVNPGAFEITAAALNSATDFFIYLWPVPFLWNVQLPVKQRLGLIFIFAIGTSLCIAGIMRIWYMHLLFTDYDWPYRGAAIWIVASVEANVGIIFACLHATKPMLSKLLPGLFGSIESGIPQLHNSRRATINNAMSSNSFHFRIFPNSPIQETDENGRKRSSQYVGKNSPPFIINWPDAAEDDRVGTFPGPQQQPLQQGPAGFITPANVSTHITSDGAAGFDLPVHGIRYTHQVSVEARMAEDSKDGEDGNNRAW